MIRDLFATPVYCDQIGDFEKVQSEIGNCIDNLDFEMNEYWGKTHYLSKNMFNEHLFDKYNLNALTKQIDYHLREYVKGANLPMKEYSYDSSWVSMFKQGNYGHIHHHCAVDIAGVYYYKTNGEDGNIFFECPVPNMETSMGFIPLADRVNFRPIEGRLLLFPGWLKHGIETNETKDTRISLSFNIFF